MNGFRSCAVIDGSESIRNVDHELGQNNVNDHRQSISLFSLLSESFEMRLIIPMNLEACIGQENVYIYNITSMYKK